MSGPHRCSRFRHLILEFISGLEFETTNGRRHPRDRIVEGQGFPLIRSSTASRDNPMIAALMSRLASVRQRLWPNAKCGADVWISVCGGRAVALPLMLGDSVT